MDILTLFSSHLALGQKSVAPSHLHQRETSKLLPTYCYMCSCVSELTVGESVVVYLQGMYALFTNPSQAARLGHCIFLPNNRGGKINKDMILTPSHKSDMIGIAPAHPTSLLFNFSNIPLIDENLSYSDPYALLYLFRLFYICTQIFNL